VFVDARGTPKSSGRRTGPITTTQPASERDAELRGDGLALHGPGFPDEIPLRARRTEVRWRTGHRYDDLEPFYEKAEWEIGVSGDQSADPFKAPRRGLCPCRPCLIAWRRSC